MRGNWLGFLFILGIFSGCSENPKEILADDFKKINDKLKKINKRLDDVENQNRKLEDNLSLALCHSDLRSLIQDVLAECGQPGAGGLEGGSGGGDSAASTPLMCGNKQVQTAVISNLGTDAQRQHQRRFFLMMSGLPHEVAYVGPGDPVFSNKQRPEKLKMLAHRQLLPFTIFIVVSSPEKGEDEASRRAEFIMKELREDGVPVERIKHWLYKFKLGPKEIERELDRPLPGETGDLTLGVWVFRADC